MISECRRLWVLSKYSIQSQDVVGLETAHLDPVPAPCPSSVLGSICSIINCRYHFHCPCVFVNFLDERQKSLGNLNTCPQDSAQHLGHQGFVHAVQAFIDKLCPKSYVSPSVFILSLSLTELPGLVFNHSLAQVGLQLDIFLSYPGTVGLPHLDFVMSIRSSEFLLVWKSSSVAESVHLKVRSLGF